MATVSIHEGRDGRARRTPSRTGLAASALTIAATYGGSAATPSDLKRRSQCRDSEIRRHPYGPARVCRVAAFADVRPVRIRAAGGRGPLFTPPSVGPSLLFRDLSRRRPAARP